MREMKDSGIEWFGEIPNSWTVRRGKALFVNTKYIPGKLSSNYDRLSLTLKGVLPRKKDDSDGLQPKDFDTYQLLRENELVFKLIDLQNVSTSRVGLAHATGLVSPAYIVLHANEEILPAFAEKFYLMMWYREIFNSLGDNGVRSSLNVSDLLNIPVCYPKMEEQIFLTDFLDTKCSEIDATAEDIQKEISLLEEYKKSLVYNVISNGINHSIYSTENDEVWGNLPQGWKLVDIKYLFEIVKRIAGKEGYDVLSVTQKGLKIKDITSGDGQLADNYCGYQFVYPTDYVMNHMDLLTGWVDCSELFGVTSPDYRVFRLIDRSAHNLVYYKYVMQCCYMNKIFYSLGQGVSNLGRWRLQTSSFNNFKVPVPPKAEQDEIADYLDSKCSEIDSLIADKKRQLDILADYKKSLIYEYVTGKKEVPVNE